MAGKRHKDVEWEVCELVKDRSSTSEAHRVNDNFVILSVLMDIRDALQQLNGRFACRNFLEIPRVLRGIRRKLPTQRKANRG